MRVLHVMPFMDPAFGGPVAAIHVMVRGLLDAGVKVDIVTVHTSRRSKAIMDESREGIQWRSFPFQTSLYNGMSLPLWQWLRSHVHEYDVLHIHGVFNFSSLIAKRVAHRLGVPCVVRPFGVLNRWGMEHRKSWLKRLFFKWLDKPLLDRVQGMHFTSDEEARDVARLEIKAPSMVIPLAVDVSLYQNLPPASVFKTHFPNFEGKKTILFLSRIDTKKGLGILLSAFKEVRSKLKDVTLIIAGDGDQRLIARLKSKAEELGIADSLLWTGFLSGDVRLSALAAVTVFCLPSHSENFGMALLEAMAAGLPCVATDQVALSAGAAKAGALCVTPVAAQPLAAALTALLSDEKRRGEMASKAREYACKHYAVPALAQRLKKTYELECAAARQRSSRPPAGAMECA